MDAEEMSAQKPYRDYLESGIPWLGIVPSHWHSARMRYVAKLNPTKGELGSLSEDTEVSFVPMEDVGEGSLALTRTKRIREVTQGFTYFRDGDVLVAKITPSFENGKGAIANALANGIGFGTTELHVLRPSAKLDRRFLYYLTTSYAFRQAGTGFMQGTAGQKRVPDDFLEDYPVTYPSLPEQQDIAAYLDRQRAKIDTLIGKKQRLLEFLQEQRSASIAQAVTKGNARNDIEKEKSPAPWLFPIPSEWTRQRIKYHSFTKGRIGYENLRAEEYVDEGPYLVSSTHFSNGRIEWDRCNHVTRERYEMAPDIILQQDDVLFMKDGALMGKLAYVDHLPGEACLNSHILVIRPRRDRCIPKFLYYVLMSQVFTAYMEEERKGTTFFGLSEEAVGNFPITLPPLSEQAEIIAYIEARTSMLDSLGEVIANEVERLREYRAALISAAVTGKIDVRESQ